VSKFKSKFINDIVNNPVKWLCISILLLLVFIPGLFKLDMVFSYRVWFHESDPLLLKLDNFEKDFETSESSLIVLHHDDGMFQKDVVEYIHELEKKLWVLDNTARVESLVSTSYIWADVDDINIDDFIPVDAKLTKSYLLERAKKVTNEESIVGSLIGKDLKTSLIYVRIKSFVGKGPPYKDIVTDIRKVLADTKKPAGLSTRLTGNPSVTYAFRESTNKDLKVLIPMLLSLVALFLYLMFRNGKVIAISFSAIFVTIAAMLGAVGYLGIKFHNMTSITPSFILAIGLADAIHIFASYFKYLGEHDEKESMLLALEKNFKPTVITTITTSIGFFSFINTDIKNIGDLGIATGIGTILAWIFTYILIAPLATMFINKKSRSYLLESKINFSKYFNFLKKYKIYIYVVNFCLICSCFFYMTKIDVNSDPLKYFGSGFTLKDDIEYVENNVGGAFSLEMSVDSGENDGITKTHFLQNVDDFSDWIEKEFETITKTSSITKIVRKMNKVFHEDKEEFYKISDDDKQNAQFLFLYGLSVPEGKSLNDRMNGSQRKIRLSAMMKNMDSKSSVSMYKKIENRAKEMMLKVELTGKRVLWQSINEKVVSSFIYSIICSLLLITLCMIIFLKSFKMGLLSILPNLMPISFGAIVLVILDRPLDIGASIVSSIVLGIAIDDTIHVISNYVSRRKQGYSREESIIETLSISAPALIITTVILSFSFACFIFASFVPNQNLGILMSICLSVALICDLTLLPLLIYDLD
jgi:predicted RND superfamily exporter protein